MNFPYRIYSAARAALKATGLIRFLPVRFRALIARFIYRVSTKSTVPLVVHGHPMYLATSGSYAPLDLVGGKFERSTTRFFEEVVKPGHVVIDIGAHVGYYTLLAAKLVGSSGRVYAFEPEPQNYTLLLKNIELNGYKNIVTVPKAVSNYNGRGQLFLSGVDNGLHSLFRLNLPKNGSVSVETTKLDTFFEKLGWPKVDLIKMDIEGSEVAALEGMAQFFGRTEQVTVVTEFCPWILRALDCEPMDLIKQLWSLGFKIDVLTRDERVPIARIDLPTFIERLLRARGYANLLCVRSSA